MTDITGWLIEHVITVFPIFRGFWGSQVTGVRRWVVEHVTSEITKVAYHVHECLDELSSGGQRIGVDVTAFSQAATELQHISNVAL